MAEEQTLYERVMFDLCERAKAVSSNVFPSTRPNATGQMADFVVVTLSTGIQPYADTHDTSWVQMTCYVRDKQSGLENIPVMSRMVQSVHNLLPFKDELITANIDKPIQLASKSDGNGFHATTLQFRVIIKS